MLCTHKTTILCQFGLSCHQLTTISPSILNHFWWELYHWVLRRVVLGNYNVTYRITSPAGQTSSPQHQPQPTTFFSPQKPPLLPPRTQTCMTTVVAMVDDNVVSTETTIAMVPTLRGTNRLPAPLGTDRLIWSTRPDTLGCTLHRASHRAPFCLTLVPLLRSFGTKNSSLTSLPVSRL